MQKADRTSVLSDFSGAKFIKHGVTTQFVRRDDRYVIRTDGPDGKLADFEVKYTFGVAPLQQYLIELPGGRLQAFTLAWDARSKKQGGQRWYDLYPAEKLRAGDELHWTGRQQNWNFMCADCHVTNLRKGYNAANNTFTTTWSEPTVGCEACHGPGAAHIAWAKSGKSSADAAKGLTVSLDERRAVSWLPSADGKPPQRNRSLATSREIEVCAQCHARRAQIAEGYHAGRPFLDHYLPALLTSGLYETDGQQRDEVYNWGSFLQSRMHAKGVTCSDCHQPHSAQLRATGNAVCTACHAQSRYDQVSHHHHRTGSAGAECKSCHMPSRVYMGIDVRHDHGFKVPRPDLTAATGAPNACTDCHRDKRPQWATNAIEQWFGKLRPGTARYAQAFSSARGGKPDAEQLLSDVLSDPSTPGIARATALRELAAVGSPRFTDAMRRATSDVDPLVRLAAAESGAALPPQQRSLLAPLLRDAHRAVRGAATNALVTRGSSTRLDSDPALKSAVNEYRDTLTYNADRPESLVQLGTLEASLDQGERATLAFEQALRLDPNYIPAYVNYADFLRAVGKEGDAEAKLRKAIALAPRNAEARHALGLSLVRQKKYKEAITELEQAAKLRPESAQYAFVLGVALHDTGSPERAIEVLQAASKRHPTNTDIASVLATYRAGLARNRKS